MIFNNKLFEVLNNDVNLKLFRLENIDKTFLWVSQEEFKKKFLIRGEITKEGNYDYFFKIINDEQQVVYAIYAGDEHVGNCGLKNIDKKEKIAELWIYIGAENARGRGWGSKALSLLLNHGFFDFDLLTIFLHVVASNDVAISMYLKYRFIELSEKDISSEWSDRGISLKKMVLTKNDFEGVVSED